MGLHYGLDETKPPSPGGQGEAPQVRPEAREVPCRLPPAPRAKACRVYSHPEVDRIWLWVYYNEIPIYPIFYLLKGHYRAESSGAKAHCRSFPRKASHCFRHMRSRSKPPHVSFSFDSNTTRGGDNESRPPTLLNPKP